MCRQATGEIAGKPDRDRREDDVERNGEAELDAGEFGRR
jgi:hypothetical protein